MLLCRPSLPAPKKQMADRTRHTKPQIYRDKILGKGNYGVVFQGVWCGKSVAVKRVQLVDVVEGATQEETTLLQLHHENVLQLFHIEIDDDFK